MQTDEFNQVATTENVDSMTDAINGVDDGVSAAGDYDDDNISLSANSSTGKSHRVEFADMQEIEQNVVATNAMDRADSAAARDESNINEDFIDGIVDAALSADIEQIELGNEAPKSFEIIDEQPNEGTTYDENDLETIVATNEPSSLEPDNEENESSPTNQLESETNILIIENDDDNILREELEENESDVGNAEIDVVDSAQQAIVPEPQADEDDDDPFDLPKSAGSVEEAAGQSTSAKSIHSVAIDSGKKSGRSENSGRSSAAVRTSANSSAGTAKSAENSPNQGRSSGQGKTTLSAGSDQLMDTNEDDKANEVKPSVCNPSMCVIPFKAREIAKTSKN